MRFEKYQALGNDFLIIRESDLAEPRTSPLAIMRQICDRHFGAGADGVEVLLEANVVKGADFSVCLYNADGGETPISGNGTRCVAAYLYRHKLWSAPSVRIATAAGIKRLHLLVEEPSRYVFSTEMGRPRLRSEEIPVILDEPRERVIREKLVVAGEVVEFTAVSMGNPHCSIFVEEFESFDWCALGAAIERHPAFPDRTNVEFIRVIDRERIEVRFWERGVGRTLASGTGACGAAIASMLNEKTERHVLVATEAGELIVEWRKDGEVIQTGEARPVYEGRWIG